MECKRNDGAKANFALRWASASSGDFVCKVSKKVLTK